MLKNHFACVVVWACMHGGHLWSQFFPSTFNGFWRLNLVVRLVWCLSYFSVAVKWHHDQGNLIKEHLMGFHNFRSEFTIILVGTVVTGKHGAVAVLRTYMVRQPQDREANFWNEGF